MGGELAVEDTPGGGLTMVVRLEAATMTRVLVVDDEPQILRALGTNLERARLRRRPRADRRGTRSTLAARTTPTSSSSTSACPGSTASR